MEVQTVTEMWVKPATPTPAHLKTFRLSLMDPTGETVPRVETTFFYNGSQDDRDGGNLTRKLQTLKTSLSEILVTLYPLAGRIKDELTIDCNDQGVRYLEAQVNCDLNEFMTGTDLSMINMLHPAVSNDRTVMIYVKVSVFRCGGLAIGLDASHTIMDAASMSIFMDAWAATARCGSTDLALNFNATSVFPVTSDFKWTPYKWMLLPFRKGNFVTRRFTFNSASINKLRDLVTSEVDQPQRRATRVEAITALLWKSFLIATRQLKREDAPKPSVLEQSVNLRTRIDPKSMPEVTKHTLGNVIWPAVAIMRPADNIDLGCLTIKIRQSISKIDAEFIEKLPFGDESEAKAAVEESLKEVKEVIADPESDNIAFSSWCRMGHYDIDFGWGKPRWVGIGSIESSFCLDFVRLTDMSDGEGIEAWVTMDKPLLDIIAADGSEFTKFATLSQTHFGL